MLAVKYLLCAGAVPGSEDTEKRHNFSTPQSNNLKDDITQITNRNA